MAQNDREPILIGGDWENTSEDENLASGNHETTVGEGQLRAGPGHRTKRERLTRSGRPS